METKTMKVLLTEDDVIMFEDHEKHAFGISSSKEELTPGGKIVFSTDKNPEGGKWENLWTHVGNWYRANLTKIRKRITDTMQNVLKPKQIETGLTIGNYTGGRYYKKNTDKVFDERSIEINIAGIPMDLVEELAESLREEFEQNAVMVVDNSNGKATILNK